MKAKRPSNGRYDQCDNAIRLIALLAIAWCLILVANGLLNRFGDKNSFHGVESLKYKSLVNKAENFIQKFESEISHSPLIQSMVPPPKVDTTEELTQQNNLRSSESTIPTKRSQNAEKTHPEKTIEDTQKKDGNAAKEQPADDDAEEKAAEEILRKNAEQRKKGLFPKGGARDAIFGIAVDTDPKNLAVFLRSLREVSKAALFLFINAPVSANIREMAKTNDVKLKEFRMGDVPVGLTQYHPSSLRWILYSDFLENNEKIKIIYKRIWLLDVRDSYFQDDPFQYIHPEQSNLHLFQGVQDKTIGQCSWNSGWIKDCFGETMAQRVSTLPIVCSGVVGGSMDMIAEYIHYMNDIIGGQIRQSIWRNHLEKHEINTKDIAFPRCERNGVDQGVHNVLVHTQILSESPVVTGRLEVLMMNSVRGGPFSTGEENVQQIFLWDNEHGFVANLQAQRNKINDQHIVVNSLDHKIAIVHQYDRIPEFQKYLFGKYVSWVNVNNFQEEWDQEIACVTFEYKEHVDYYKGICDLKVQGGATSGASCCKHCANLPDCKGFTYYAGQCFLKNCNDRTKMKNIGLNNAVSGVLKN